MMQLMLPAGAQCRWLSPTHEVWKASRRRLPNPGKSELPKFKEPACALHSSSRLFFGGNLLFHDVSSSVVGEHVNYEPSKPSIPKPPINLSSAQELVLTNGEPVAIGRSHQACLSLVDC